MLDAGLHLLQRVCLWPWRCPLPPRLFSSMTLARSGILLRQSSCAPVATVAVRWSKDTVLLTEALDFRRLLHLGQRPVEEAEELEEVLDLRDSFSLVGLRGGRGGGVAGPSLDWSACGVGRGSSGMVVGVALSEVRGDVTFARDSGLTGLSGLLPSLKLSGIDNTPGALGAMPTSPTGAKTALDKLSQRSLPRLLELPREVLLLALALRQDRGGRVGALLGMKSE